MDWTKLCGALHFYGFHFSPRHWASKILHSILCLFLLLTLALGRVGSLPTFVMAAADGLECWILFSWFACVQKKVGNTANENVSSFKNCAALLYKLTLGEQQASRNPDRANKEIRNGAKRHIHAQKCSNLERKTQFSQGTNGDIDLSKVPGIDRSDCRVFCNTTT